MIASLLIYVSLDICKGSCNTIDDLSSRICVPNKTEHVNSNVFNKITGIIESKTLTKTILCKYKSKVHSRKCNSNQKWNNGTYWRWCKNPMEKCV